MTIKEKFSALLPFYNVNDNNNKSTECENIADDYAIGFIKWYASSEGMDLIHDLQIVGEIGKNVTPEQVLEIYKKDKGL